MTMPVAMGRKAGALTGDLVIGAVLGRIFDVYRQQIGVLFPAALILFIPAAIIATLLVLIITPLLLGLSGAPGLAVSLIALVAFVPIVVVGVWYVGVVVAATEDMEDGTRDISIGGLLQNSSAQIPRLVGAGLLAIAVLLALGILAMLASALLPSWVVVVMFALVTIYLLVLWALIAPAIVVEGATVTGAFSRSSSLIRTRFWRVFAIFLVVYSLALLVGWVFILVGSVFDDSLIIRQLIQAIANGLVAPFAALTNAIVFFELRRIER